MASNLTDLLRQRLDAAVASQISRGVTSQADLVDFVRSRVIGEPASIPAMKGIIRRGRQAADAARRLNQAGPDDVLLLGGVPRNPALPRPFVYGVRVFHSLGGSSGFWRIHEISAREQLTIRELQEQALNQAARWQINTGSPQAQQTATAVPINPEAVFVIRR